MTNNTLILQKTVYHRRGTRHVVPETEANKKDPSMVAMTVEEAIKAGYMEDFTKSSPVEDVTPSELINLRKDNQALLEKVRQLESQVAKAEEATPEFEPNKDESVQPTVEKVEEQLVIPQVEGHILSEQVEDDDVQNQLDALLNVNG